MILNYHTAQLIYIIGSGVVAHELQKWVQADSINPVIIVGFDAFQLLPLGSCCILGFWNIFYRQEFLAQDVITQYQWPTYVHPQAYVDDVNMLKPGTVVYPMCQVGYGVSIGEFGLIGPMCQLGHGCVLGPNVVISPSTVIGGSTVVGDHVMFGQHSSIRNKINIASNSKFTMNSVVTKDIVEPGNYYGNKRANVEF
jgi:UDP-3-O-[3-hydroxymyristoyl] glucosamine N-acyltransferase